jgi:limonene 1,2-monooxygenase
MMGIDPLTQRQHMDEALGAIIRLLDGETVNHKSEFFELHDAKLQMLPLHGRVPVFVASTFSPAGAVTAGKHGAGVLSLGAGFAGSKKDLVGQWALGEQTAAEHGKTICRDDWRVVLRVHLSDTHEQALADVETGWSYEAKSYFAWGKKDRTLQDEIDNDTALVGTPDEVIAQIERIQEETGGFGGLLVLAHEWATREKTLHSYELLARYVMPHFNGMYTQLADSWDATVARGRATRDDLVAVVSKAFVDAGKPVPEDMSIGNLR